MYSNRLRRVGRLGAAATAVVMALTAVQAHAWPAKIEHIADGDTFTAVNKNTGERFDVRFKGIDTPETDHGPGRPGQPYGPPARKALKKILDGRDVDVRPTGARSYDRIIARVFVQDDIDVAGKLVSWGYAWDSPKYDREHRYTQAHRAARQANRGLWSQANPVAPWEWRRNRWND